MGSLKLSLAYRILTMPPHFAQDIVDVGLNMSAASERARLFRAMLLEGIMFRLDNVAEFHALGEKKAWDLADDIPNWAPPFSSFWMEWNAPSETSRSVQFGVHALCLPVNDENRSDLPQWQKLVAMSCSFAGDGQWIGDIPDLGRARWMIVFDVWGTTSERPWLGKPNWLGLQVFVLVGPGGEFLSHFSSGAMAIARIQSQREEDLRGMAHAVAEICGLGLSFTHCKNVTQTETVERPSARAARGGVPDRLTYRVLDIGPMRDILRSEGDSDVSGIPRAMHVCRGHFANYGEDAPLFGKHIGSFWIPDHIRGNRAFGRIFKDYRVNPSLKQ